NVLTNDTDVDAGDTKTVSGIAAGSVGSASGNVGSSVTGTYGSIIIAADGSYTYTVDNSNSAVQALRTTANTLSDVFTYTMQDAAGLTSTTQVTVTIQGANDAPNDITGTLSVAENSRNGTSVGTVVGQDVDAGDTRTYSLVDNAGGRFAINNSTGLVTVANGSMLDFETATSHNITIRVTDATGATFDKVMTVQVTNVNEAPLAITDTATAVEAGGLSTGTSGTNPAGNVLTNDTDVDAGDTKTVTGVEAGVVGSASMNVGSAVIGNYGSINISSTGAYTYTVNDSNAIVQALRTTANTLTDVFTYTISDAGGISSTTQLTVTIQGRNDTPYDITTGSLSVAEDAVIATVVGSVMGQDVDSGDILTYSLTNNAGGRFAIDTTTGQITVASGSMLDFEVFQSHQIVVRVIDASGTSFSKTLVVSVTNVNEAPVDITTGNQSISVSNSGFESNVLGDGGAISSAFDWTVTGGGGTFNPTSTQYITSNGTEGSNIGYANPGATLAQALSTVFDANRNYQLTVDVGRRLDTANSSYTIQLLSGATVIGTYTGTTGDSGSWRTVNVDINGANFAAASGNPLQITLHCNSGGQTHFDNVRLTSSTATASIAEDSANGAVVTTVTGSDRDAGNTLTYSLMNNADGRFAIDNATGQITVANGSLLNFETNTSHTVVIRTTDQGNLTFDRTMSIGVTNVNETPVAIADSAAAVEAGGTSNGAAGINPAGNVLYNDTDVDGGDTKTVNGVAAGVVASVSTNVGSNVIGTYGSINIAADGSYTYTIDNSNSAVQALRTTANTLSDVFTYTMKDAAGLTSTAQITVTIQGANDTPNDITGTLTIPENSSNGAIVGTVTGQDVDSGDTRTYSLVDNAGGRFVIDSTTGQVTVADGTLLNFEAATSHNITVRVTDAAGATFDRVMAVSVTNTNDAPDLNNSANPTLGTVLEGATNPSGVTVASLVVDSSITDVDGTAVEAIAITGLNTNLGTWQYSLDGGTSWLMIDANLINNTTN
ncbi:MAG: beta strand repeat-containing protein, partial [Pirellula sp.]